MIVDALNWVLEHPFAALYVAILAGIAFHGFRPATRIFKTDNSDDQDNENNQ